MLNGEEIREVITRLAKVHSEDDYSVRARLITTHGSIKHLWGGSNFSIGDDRVVHLVLLSGAFTFRRRKIVNEVDNMQIEIDAVDGDVLTLSYCSSFRKYYDDPSLLDVWRNTQ